MLSWTGERYLPNASDGAGPDIVYEHLSRYLFAQRFCRGKTVIDVPSGEGFGTEILSQVATSVIGIDIAADAVEHANKKYKKNNLNYVHGSMADLSAFPEGSIDVLTCFEGIEHVDQETQAKALKEFSRVLKSDGLLFISSPNKKVYSDHQNYKNPYHVHEFYPQEFDEFLKKEFRAVRTLGQNVAEGSIISPLDSSDNVRLGGQLVTVGDDTKSDQVFPLPTDPDRYMYLISVCSKTELPAQIDGHFMVDLDRATLFRTVRHLKFHIQHLEDVVTKERKCYDATVSHLQANYRELEQNFLKLEAQYKNLLYVHESVAKESQHFRATLGGKSMAITRKARSFFDRHPGLKSLVAPLFTSSVRLIRKFR